MSIVIETDAEETPASAAPDVFQDTSETSVTQCAIFTVSRRVNELPVPATHAWMVITGQTVQIHVAPDVELFSVDRRAGNAWTAVGRGGRGLSARPAQTVSMASTAPVAVTKIVWMNFSVMP